MNSHSLPGIATSITRSYSSLNNDQEYIGLLVLDELLSKEAKNISLIVNFILMCGTVACFGIVGNIINLHIFSTQGFESTINISLFGIAVSDLCALLTVIWLGICVNPAMQTDEIAFEEIEYLTAGWPHCLFARITCMITVYITIERCLCVAIPLKVKNVITTKTTMATVTCIFISQLMTAIPTYYSAYLGWMFIPEKNRSMLRLCRIDNWEEIELIAFFLQAIMQGGSFILLILFTVLLVVNIRRKTKWRTSSTSDTQKESIFVRDAKLVRMIVLIAGILIICFTPGMIAFIGMIIEPEYNMGGKYDHVFWVTWSIVIVFQTANSSVNIFVYFRMSSRYRDIFNMTFAGYRKHLHLPSK